jgi:anti-anti-sigma factor
LIDVVFDPKSLSGTTGASPIGAGAPALGPGDGLQTRAVVEPAGEQHNSRSPLKITGDLSIAAVAAQHATLAGFLAQGLDVALDLCGVHACDTAGLQLIYSLGKSVRQRKGQLQIVAVSLEVQELATALGLQLQQLNNVRSAAALDAGSLPRSTTGGL